MKKLLALLMALLMALSCIIACAEEAAPFAMTITGTTTIDQEAAKALLGALELGDEGNRVVDLVLPLLSNMGERLTLTDSGLQYDVSLKGKDVLSVAGALTDEGCAIVSTLFPNYLVTMKAETLIDMLNRLTSSVNEGQDLAAMLEPAIQTVSDAVNEFINATRAAISYGDAEQGDYTIGDYTFNTCVPILVDEDAVIEAARAMSDKINADPSVQAFEAALKEKGLDLETHFVGLNEGETMDIDCNVYMTIGEDGEAAETTCTSVKVAVTDAESKTETICVNVIPDETGNVFVGIEVPEEDTALELTVMPAEEGWDLYVDINAQGYYMGFHITAIVDDNRTYEIDTFLMNADKPVIHETITIENQGALTLSLDAEGKKLLAVEDAMNDTEGETLNGIGMDVMLFGLGGLISAATEAMPEEVGALTAMFMGGNTAEAG